MAGVGPATATNCYAVYLQLPVYVALVSCSSALRSPLVVKGPYGAHSLLPSRCWGAVTVTTEPRASCDGGRL
jgi:hypothetical protein